MKNSFAFLFFLIAVPVILIAQQNNLSGLTGPYIGQKQPGDTPQLFAPDFISTGLQEGICTFTPGGNEMIYLVVYRKPHERRIFTTLVTSKIKNGIWTSPEFVEFSDIKYNDMYPFITYDGKELFFQSNRPTNKPELANEWNIWKCTRIKGGWSAPEPLPSPVNGRGDVSGPSLSLTGEFYFTLMSGDENDGIYVSNYNQGVFSDPQRLPDCVNVKEKPFDGVIAPDGSYYIVNVYNKADSYGGTDLYATFRDSENNWSHLINLGENINTKLNEGSAMISPDGLYMFFAGCFESHNFYNDTLSYQDLLNSNLKPQYGSSDIYWVSTNIIESLRPKN